MKTFKTNAICPKCGKQLLTTDIPDYAFVCLECDENFYSIEVCECAGEHFEISVECSENLFSEHENELQEILPNLLVFLGYDTEVQVADFGFSRILHSNEIASVVRQLDVLSTPNASCN